MSGIIAWIPYCIFFWERACYFGLFLYSFPMLFLFRWKGRSSCGLATGHREEEIFTTNWISTTIFHGFSRSFSFLSKWHLQGNSILNLVCITKTMFLRYLVQIIKYIYWKCLLWKFWSPFQGSRLVLFICKLLACLHDWAFICHDYQILVGWSEKLGSLGITVFFPRIRIKLS